MIRNFLLSLLLDFPCLRKIDGGDDGSTAQALLQVAKVIGAFAFEKDGFGK